jgi:hypothetical protein
MSNEKDRLVRPYPEEAPLSMEVQDLSPPAWLRDRLRRVLPAWRRLPTRRTA